MVRGNHDWIRKRCHQFHVCRRSSDHADEQQDDEEHENRPKTTGRPRAPACRMRPCWPRADEEQDQQYDQDRVHGDLRLLVGPAAKMSREPDWFM